MSKPTTRLDSTRGGSREYTDQEAERVRQAMLRRVGKARLTTIADLSLELGIEGRTLRAILSALDGREFLLGGGNEGVFVCAYAEEGDDMTGRIAGTAKSLQARADRRTIYGETLPRRQGKLLGF